MNILITAGPTREYVDTVRFISNAASGKMGYAIASEAIRRAHTVTVVSGPVSLPPPAGAEVLSVVTAAEMLDTVMARFVDVHAFIMTAAVCDYRPSRRSERKIKKTKECLSLDLESTVDICARVGRVKDGRVLVGFAMEDRDHRRSAESKLRNKCCDAIVLNRVDAMGQNESTIEVLRAVGGWSDAISGTKPDLARHIVDLIESLALTV